MCIRDRILIVSDSSGIKSVNILDRNFDPSLDFETSLDSTSSPRASSASQVSSQTDTPNTAIDEKVLKLLLENASRKKV